MRRLVTRFWRPRLVGVEGLDRRSRGSDEVREVVRLGAQERLVDERRVLVGAGRGLVELPEALGAAVLDQRVAELLAGRSGGSRRTSRLERRQHLVELHRGRGLGDREGVAVGRRRATPGCPGCRSTKRLPSRNSRGRSLKVASSWIGRPSSLISIVTIAACCAAGWPAAGGRPWRIAAVAASAGGVVAGQGSTLGHLADVDAGDPHRRLLARTFCAVVNTALTS